MKKEDLEQLNKGLLSKEKEDEMIESLLQKVFQLDETIDDKKEAEEIQRATRLYDMVRNQKAKFAQSDNEPDLNESGSAVNKIPDSLKAYETIKSRGFNISPKNMDKRLQKAIGVGLMLFVLAFSFWLYNTKKTLDISQDGGIIFAGGQNKDSLAIYRDTLKRLIKIENNLEKQVNQHLKFVEHNKLHEAENIEQILSDNINLSIRLALNYIEYGVDNFGKAENLINKILSSQQKASISEENLSHLEQLQKCLQNRPHKKKY